nr:hypothetical protein Iba_scaffold41872CG0010 [Ipomoea batatas]GME17917.1 hypothetical protein Iba_scaffold19670CG0020 [Ipomoea batatas]GME21640.1 hypothetical protein Iba_scaffold28698CG0010 [Ipomoea batatas]
MADITINLSPMYHLSVPISGLSRRTDQTQKRTGTVAPVGLSPVDSSGIHTGIPNALRHSVQLSGPRLRSDQSQKRTGVVATVGLPESLRPSKL